MAKDITLVTNCTLHDIHPPAQMLVEQKGGKGETPPPILVEDKDAFWLPAARVTPVPTEALERWRKNKVFANEFKAGNLVEGKLSSEEIEHRLDSQARQRILSSKAGKSEDRLGLGEMEQRPYIGAPDPRRNVYGGRG